jgi:hypothetical protein
MNRFLAVATRIHPGQLATIWVTCVLLAVFVLWQRSAVTASITSQRQTLRARILADNSYRNSYTPEQRARAEAFDERENAKSWAAIKRLRLLRVSLDGVLVLAAAFPLLISWFWFGARASPSREAPTDISTPITPPPLPTIPRVIMIALLVIGGIVAFVLGEAVILWLRR